MIGSIIRLQEQDRHIILRHLIRLDRESRFSRFFLYMSDDSLARHVEALDFSSDALFGYIVDGDVRGVGHIVFCSNGEAELAFSIETGFRRIGVGRSLMDRMITEAARIGALRLKFCTQPANAGMVSLGKRLGFTIRRDEEGLGGFLDIGALAA
jgi:GNAT superfamily N-acetyltransferase